ncbi:hypothetical protein EDC01DRAFT_763413 [Geopyxis carbonaria]|nr:hypothetical protein EDC01DRAFT_763413 [Geopyxis carbonaria]
MVWTLKSDASPQDLMAFLRFAPPELKSKSFSSNTAPITMRYKPKLTHVAAAEPLTSHQNAVFHRRVTSLSRALNANRGRRFRSLWTEASSGCPFAEMVGHTVFRDNGARADMWEFLMGLSTHRYRMLVDCTKPVRKLTSNKHSQAPNSPSPGRLSREFSVNMPSPSSLQITALPSTFHPLTIPSPAFITIHIQSTMPTMPRPNPLILLGSEIFTPRTLSEIAQVLHRCDGKPPPRLEIWRVAEIQAALKRQSYSDNGRLPRDVILMVHIAESLVEEVVRERSKGCDPLSDTE